MAMILMLSLWATVTNIVPVSVFFVVLAPIVPFALIRRMSSPKLVAALLLLYAYFIISTLFYAPNSFLEAEFYRRDGNFFVTFLPILISGISNLKLDLERILLLFIRWVTSVNLVFICIFLVTGSTYFEYEPGIYHFLFEAHNAAGGYLAMVTAFSLGIFLGKRKSLLSMAIVAINAFGLVLTASRGSLIGIAMAIFVVLLLKERFIKTILTAMCIGTVSLLLYIYPDWVSSGKPTHFQAFDSTFFGDGEELTSSDATIADRIFFLWPRAVDLFIQSPIVGTGFGSYNDLPYRFEGIPNFISFNVPLVLRFDSSHAHNSYLHVLAETGLLGFGLLLVVLRETYKEINRIQFPALQLGLKLGFWVAIFSSMTEHRLFTPSEMLPFTIVLALAMAVKQYHAVRSSAGILSEQFI